MVSLQLIQESIERSREKWAICFLAIVCMLLLSTCGGGGGGSDGGVSSAVTPSMPTGLAVTASSSSEISLSWSASTDDMGVAGYKVYREGTYLKSITGTSTTDTGLSTSTQYCYKISAYDAAGNESPQCTQQCATTQGPGATTGFNFPIEKGDFWEYRWDYYMNSYAQGSTPSTTSDAGRFWVVLGSPTTIQGITAYAVDVYGKSKTTDKTFSPRWKYLAMDNNQMLGSTDGVTLKPFFDGQAGKWPGGGFFTTLEGLIIAQSGTISTTNTYISGTAMVAGRSSNQNMCEYFPGVGTICGDSSYNYWEYEYFRPSVGPVGYYYKNTYSDCGGGFCSGGNWEHNVGMTASSFTGQANPLVVESEPNDSWTTAKPITTTSPIIGTVSESTLVNVGNTQIDVVVNSVSISPTVEDWYSFSLATPGKVTITLSFEGDPTADLDLYLMPSSGPSGNTLNGASVADNPVTHVQTEKIKVSSLAAGDYVIGVDGYSTPSGAVTYTLQLE